MSARAPPNALRGVCRACRRNGPNTLLRRAFHQRSSAINTRQPPRVIVYGLVFGIGAACLSLAPSQLHAEAPEEPTKSKQKADAKPTPVEVQIEETKSTEGLSKEDTRNLISNQHQQVEQSWRNPGVYAWGSNAGRVAAPDSDEPIIKTPRRISFFDAVLLRDLKLSQKAGAAINERGDLLQWGSDYASGVKEPVTTLKGKNLVSLELSNDRVIALSASGTVYSIPTSRDDQENGHKPSESSWIPFWPSSSRISYRTIQPSLSSFPWSESITSIAAGLSHVLLLTSSGRVFSSAASSTIFPASGQLGIPGLTWSTRPSGPFDQPHELSTLNGFKIKAVAAGDNHSLVLDSAGRVFAFGDNGSGQLGLSTSSGEFSYVDAPSLLPTERLYSGNAQVPRVTFIAAGGNNSFFTIDATKIARPTDEDNPSARAQIGRISADTWACGSGIMGTLGNGRWTHNQITPTKIKTLSGLFEYDEPASKVIPIRIHRLSVGATHASATLANVTYVSASKQTGKNDTNWGADVLWWGGNEHWQLGTGKRNNVSTPTYIGTLDGSDVLGTAREEHRFHATPLTKVRIGGRWVDMEQKVYCGRNVSAVYSGV